MLGYLGPARPLRELVSQGAHSLLVQSYHPREMTSGTVNADGYGAALWLADGNPEPVLYRTNLPIWSDPNLVWMGERLRVRAALAAVRSATPGIGYELSNVQPFARGRLSFLHNGFITGFRGGPERALRERLGKAAYESITGTSDSEQIFALILDALDKGAASLPLALRAGIKALDEVCRREERTAVASIILSDGENLLGCRWSRGLAPASLYVSQRLPGAMGAPAVGSFVASEPIDVSEGADRAHWREVPPGSLFVMGKELHLEPLA